VIQLLANGGVLPAYEPEAGPKISPRRRGVKQGGILLLTGALLVPILGVLVSFSGGSDFLQLLAAIAALLCFVGGPLRMLYAGLFEEGAPSWPKPMNYTHAPMPLQSGLPVRNSLPPPQTHDAPSWRQRPRTSELVRPPSVTEGTTRLLDKDEPGDREHNL
jgi:hypothetical protein